MATLDSPCDKPMNASNDNRAVSALFRVFGGAGELPVADAYLPSKWRGMHQGENSAFSTLIPLTVLVAIGHGLVSLLGIFPGLVLVVPATFLALNVLPFVLAGKHPLIQWQLWFCLLVTWAVWHRHESGIVGFFCYLWIAICVMSLTGWVVIAWQRAMIWKGTPGIIWRLSLLVMLHLLVIVSGLIWGWPCAVFGGAVIAAIYCFAVLSPSSQWLGPVYLRTNRSQILITIDDGPDPHDTPILLDLLDQHQTKAIFFMIGEKVRAHPELAREVIRRGHEIGNHTMTHPQASFWMAGPWRTKREIVECQKIIGETTGVRPRWFRAPVGHRNFFTHPITGLLGLRVMAWNRRGFDAVASDAKTVLARIVPCLAPGDIVLIHESTPIAEDVLSGILAAEK